MILEFDLLCVVGEVAEHECSERVLELDLLGILDTVVVSKGALGS